MNSKVFLHAIAFAVVAVWGSTFVVTKMLLQDGLSPAQIFTLRFVIAYVLLLAYSLGRSMFHSQRSTFFSSSWRDELLMVLLGITGGSVYFLAENAAMLYTTATNTSLIVCSCPLFTLLLMAVFWRKTERFTRVQVTGSLLACLGMVIVVMNGHFVLHLSPLGDLLAFAACLCWAFYSLLMKKAVERYSPLFITRKVFFYGLLTMIPYYIWVPSDAGIFISPSTLHLAPSTIFNLLFLGVVASLLCYVLWNWVISKLGAVVATNWVYCNPLVTILFAWWLLNEPVTPWLILGTLLILFGMYLADRKHQ